MQRSKIKVGGEYAASTYRDWERYGLTMVQVLDAAPWHHLSHWDKEGIAAPPETVPEPEGWGDAMLEVPGEIRRGDGHMTRDRNRVLVRAFSEDNEGNRTYQQPITMATRALVAPLEEAKARREAYITRTREARDRADAESARRRAVRDDFDRRLRGLGYPQSNGFIAGYRVSVDETTLDRLLTLAERARALGVTTDE